MNILCSAESERSALRVPPCGFQEAKARRSTRSGHKQVMNRTIGWLLAGVAMMTVGLGGYWYGAHSGATKVAAAAAQSAAQVDAAPVKAHARSRRGRRRRSRQGRARAGEAARHRR